MRILGSRGQASIFIALIFQVLFIFFAMVINVGVLVHDKINLQNSADIAAYYGAMKQAEVLNAIGHVNFQLRQAWKLLNWRIWALGDAGRNTAFRAGAPLPQERAAVWEAQGGVPPFEQPVVCVKNPLWYESARIQALNQNLCRYSNLSVPPLQQVTLNPIQMLFPEERLYAELNKRNIAKFTKDCSSGGILNQSMAFAILASYKNAVRARRAALQALERLLTVSDNSRDMRDITGENVNPVIDRVLKNNLTAGNLAGITKTDYINSLVGQPFLVPIEVRLFIKYADLWGSSGQGCQAAVRMINELPTQDGDPAMLTLINAFMGPDTANPAPQATAESFVTELALKNYASLVGVEKNPWVQAYYHVKVRTRPKLIFSPIGNNTVELVAESIATPFGGRVGPWYYDTWFPGQGQSTPNGNNKIDSLLPVRLASGQSFTQDNTYPNYSRFPGDQLGMRSELARTALLGPANLPDDQKPHVTDDDYFNFIEESTNPKVDPVVYSTSSRTALRSAELAAISPNLFDATYYSINPDFETDVRARGGDFFLTQICGQQCFDFGKSKTLPAFKDFSVAKQLDQAAAIRNTALGRDTFWILKDPDHVRSAWAQESNDRYLASDGGSTKIGQPAKKGGRIGYSVKIVSCRSLTRPDLPLGGGGANPVTGAILNPPTCQ